MKQELVGKVPGNVLGMLADLNHKLQHGKITPEELGKFLKRRNPFEKAMAEEDLRTVVMREGITVQNLIADRKALFPVYVYYNLDGLVSDRSTKEAYEVRFRNRVEADEELQNKSANDLQAAGISCITLEERLQMEIDYFKETGKHLDIRNVTLCAGSRNTSGYVPGVYWDDGGLCVGWYDPDDRSGSIRARAVIS